MISQSDQWLGVELRHFAALQAIAAEGSFRRAAERLGYTQSAVSQQIAVLERIAGERLIERPGGPRPVALTEAGTMLLSHAEAIMARVHAAQADLRAFHAGAIGSLRVGTYQSTGRHILPALIRRFAEQWPQVEVRLTESANDDELLPLIESGELDLSFAIHPLPDGPFASQVLLHDPYVLVVPVGSPLARSGRSVTLDEIGELALISYRQCRSTRMSEAHLRSRGIEPNIVFRSDDNGTVQALVASGMGAALVPRLVVERDDPSISVIEIAEPLPPRRIALVWHRDRYRSPAARAFTDCAAAICRELGGIPEDHLRAS